MSSSGIIFRLLAKTMHGVSDKSIYLKRYLSLFLNKQLMLELFMKKYFIPIQLVLKWKQTNIYSQKSAHK